MTFCAVVLGAFFALFCCSIYAATSYRWILPPGPDGVILLASK